MSWVFVNGVAVLEDGKWTAARPGRVLRRGQESSRQQ
jgi:N-acyl-D-aspartate/D-glutamate deacylase